MECLRRSTCKHAISRYTSSKVQKLMYVVAYGCLVKHGSRRCGNGKVVVGQDAQDNIKRPDHLGYVSQGPTSVALFLFRWIVERDKDRKVAKDGQGEEDKGEGEQDGPHVDTRHLDQAESHSAPCFIFAWFAGGDRILFCFWVCSGEW